MKLTRRQLIKLIEAKIKPTLDIPGLGDRAQKNLYTMAAGRDLDAAGRQSADNTLDSLVGAFQFDEEPFSKREFEWLKMISGFGLDNDNDDGHGITPQGPHVLMLEAFNSRE